ncbi:hypothetical protein K7432_007324 [Basidiobolus ranarum]|uniref:Uncharacterized protein n=1 Tax=Basidiobolus ranarum TaxID=34480 RepID=A0ABR2W0R0_9FUNG
MKSVLWLVCLWWSTIEGQLVVPFQIFPSEECQRTLDIIVETNLDSECLPLRRLIPHLTRLTKDPDNVKVTVSSMIDTVCAAPTCSSPKLNAIKKKLYTGCQRDLTNPIVATYLWVFQSLSPLRDWGCPRASNGERCFDAVILTWLQNKNSVLLRDADPGMCRRCHSTWRDTIRNNQKNYPSLDHSFLNEILNCK